MECNEDDLILERIKDGSILGELIDYSCLDLKSYETEPFDHLVRYNKRGILPKITDLAKSTGEDRNHLHEKYIELCNERILSKFTFSQIFRQFGYYKHFTPALPKTLDEATKHELDGMRRNCNFRKRINHDSPSNTRPCFFLALVTETNVNGIKVPVFQSIFNFLPYYQTKPISV